jgi:hypothetical protein
MKTCLLLMQRSSRLIAPFALLLSMLAPAGLHAQLMVDCSGADPNAFPTINSALPHVTPGSSVIVMGTCNEDVVLQGLNGFSLGAWWGQAASINGKISVLNSGVVYLYGLNVSNAAGDGFLVASSKSVVLDACTSSGNNGIGLNVTGMSDVIASSPAAFDNNSNGGINVSSNSNLYLAAWNGVIDVSNNIGPGIYVTQAALTSLGHTTIANNRFGSFLFSGYGLDLRGGARAQFGAISGPNILLGNESGGASVTENAELSFWTGGQPNIIQSNGPVGVSAGFGGQITLFNSVQIMDHAGPAVDLYANSQAYLFGQNQVLRNGVAGDPLSAAIRVDGNSQALLRGGDISQNIGPALLALVNSSVDFTGVNFSGNTSGIITCDSTATMISDLARPETTPAAGVRCKTPHALRNRRVTKAQTSAPDLTAYRALQAKYRKVATRH